jgi:hypothetical protein
VAALAGCSGDASGSEAVVPLGASQPEQAGATPAPTQDAAVTVTVTAAPMPTDDDDLELKVAAIHASEAAASRSTVVPAREVAAPAREVSPKKATTAPKRKRSNGAFTGTGHIVEHRSDDRANFRNSYHDGDACEDGFHYVVDIYDSSDNFVTVGSMQFGVLKNVQKHSG